MTQHKTSNKIEKLICDGDAYATKGKFDKALKKYRKAHDLAPDYEGLGAKLIAAHEKALGEHTWSREDFAFHLDLVMRQQERDNPSLKQTHAKLSPEWKDVVELAVAVVGEADDAKAAPLIDKLVAHGEIATRALIDLMRTLAHTRGDEHEDTGGAEDTQR